MLDIKLYLQTLLPSRLRTSDWLTMDISGALYSGSLLEGAAAATAK